MMSKFRDKPTILRLKSQARTVGKRLADHHVNLAVTGLSRSGKTAFITSLVNQLLHASDTDALPFFNVVAEGRVIGVKRDTQPDLTLSRFAYEQAIENISSHPANWPNSTDGISQIRLKLKYRPQSALRKLLAEHSTLTIDITDYPGEWLLDLPLLETTYSQWCGEFWRSIDAPKKHQLAKPFLAALNTIDWQKPVDELQLQAVAEKYTDFLHHCKSAGYQLIQPGRFVLPGELKGAPVLHFFPIPLSCFEKGEQNTYLDPVAALLSNRYEQYRQKVVTPFYKNHFRRFDRQIVLIDCLSALNMGPHSFRDLQSAIHWLLGSFQYGRSNVLKRLFSPAIDKLMFAASKADIVVPQQQQNLVKLLDSMVRDARQDIQYEGVKTESTAISAIRTSKVGSAKIDGKPTQILQGIGEDAQAVTLYPGDVPTRCPNDEFWACQSFDFPDFRPPSSSPNDKAIAHLRMDHVLQFVLGDKLE